MIDATRSKRTIREDISEEDRPRLMDSLARISESIDNCESIAMALGLNEKYNKTVALSVGRFIEIFEKSCKVPMTPENLAFHAEVRGRMSERLRLTLEIDSLKYEIKDGIRKKSLIEKLLARLTRRGEEKDGQ